MRDVLKDDSYTVAETPDAITALRILRGGPDTLIMICGTAPGETLVSLRVFAFACLLLHRFTGLILCR